MALAPPGPMMPGPRARRGSALPPASLPCTLATRPSRRSGGGSMLGLPATAVPPARPLVLLLR
eukprot:6472064-Alexandrium_andersonii.AAC.1